MSPLLFAILTHIHRLGCISPYFDFTAATSIATSNGIPFFIQTRLLQLCITVFLNKPMTL